MSEQMQKYPDDWDKMRQRAIKRDGGECVSCGTSDCYLHVDHVVPLSRDGPNILENLQTLCPDCHATKHDCDSCNLCGTLVYGQPVDDPSYSDWKGAGSVTLCEDCMRVLEDRSGGAGCSICQSDVGKKSATIYRPVTKNRDTATVCSDCRSLVCVETEWRARGELLENILPSGHPFYNHWNE